MTFVAAPNHENTKLNHLSSSSLAGGEIDHSFPTHRVCDSPALSRVLAIGFHSQSAAARNIQPPSCKRLLRLV